MIGVTLTISAGTTSCGNAQLLSNEVRRCIHHPRAVVLISAFVVRSKVNQARRETSYRTAVSSFQRDLHMGMDRADAQKYLDSRRADYHSVGYGGGDVATYEVKLSEEPGNSLVCEGWGVYLALELAAAEKLREIHVRKIGTYLYCTGYFTLPNWSGL